MSDQPRETTAHDGKKPGQFAPGDRVKVGKGVGGKLEGKEATVVSGPHKINGMGGIYKVKHEETGYEEDWNGDRLSHHSPKSKKPKPLDDIAAFNASVAAEHAKGGGSA